MTIYAYIYGHNEIKMLPLKKRWCDHHGVTMMYFDNESTDGSLEWAKEQGVLAGEINTDGAFDLRLILPPMNQHLHEFQPDWFMMMGVDLFFAHKNRWNLSDVLTTTMSDMLKMDYLNVCYTGDEKQDGRLDEFSRLSADYSNAFTSYALISRYSLESAMGADKIHCPAHFEIVNMPFWCMFNFGHTKTAEEREETYRRRQLAWERGLNPSAGMHYKTGKALNWTYPRDKTVPLSLYPEYKKAFENLMKIIYP